MKEREDFRQISYAGKACVKTDVYKRQVQVGARNMQNFELLKEVGKMSKPILHKINGFFKHGDVYRIHDFRCV